MKQLVNKNLITLKCVLFCFLSGVGCIFPFLPKHMLDVGLDRAEARLISAVAPCVALLGPACLGLLIDKLSVGRGSTGGGNDSSGSGRLLRVVTALCLILSAVFYTLLLAVPYTNRQEARRPEVLFMCDEDGAYVMQNVCQDEVTSVSSCKRWDGAKTGVLALRQCEYGCADQNLTWLRSPYPVPVSNVTTLSPMYNSVANSTSSLDLLGSEDDDDIDFEKDPPHLCYEGVCSVYMQHAGRMRLHISLVAPKPLEDNATEEGQWCTYNTEKASQCIIPEAHRADFELLEDCKPAVRCQVLDPYDEPGSVMAEAECPRTVGNPTYSFWTYFIIRVIADIWPTAALALLGAACVIATRETSLGRGDVGRQLAFGTIGLAIWPPLAGLAAQDLVKEGPYLVPFLMHAAFMIIGALILLVDQKMPLSTPEWWWHTSTGVLTMPMNAVRRYGAETAAVFAVVTLLGVLCSGIDSYLPWTVFDLKGNFLEIGLTMTAGALPAIPALWWAEALVDYIGHSNVFITAFIFYCLRFTGLAYSSDYNWIVVIEVVEVFTLSLVWVTCVLYFRHLVPRKFTATGQALPVIAHFCLGRCIGAIIGGVVSLKPELDSARDVYRALGVVSLVSAAVYLALYHLLLAPRCAAPAHPPPTHLLQGLSANGGSNGTYSPMRVYHEERSRKGLAYSSDYNWIVVIEVVEVFTLSLVWVTCVLYFRHLVPRKFTATGQALPVIAHFCLGRCIGAIIGGVVSLKPELDSARDVYRALGVVSLVSAAVYLALYHLLLAPRCAAPAHPPPTHLLQGLSANGGSNGTYSPMRVYHEERSRKGHFRY